MNTIRGRSWALCHSKLFQPSLQLADSLGRVKFSYHSVRKHCSICLSQKQSLCRAGLLQAIYAPHSFKESYISKHVSASNFIPNQNHCCMHNNLHRGTSVLNKSAVSRSSLVEHVDCPNGEEVTVI